MADPLAFPPDDDLRPAQLPDDLNEPQRVAAAHVDGPLLIFAGAGSGKTRVIVYRVANLVAVHRVAPYRILAVTFTNKAAGEMRGRADALMPHGARGLWVGTFHGIAHRLLRQHWREAQLPEAFQILDSDDQQRLIKRVIQSMNLDEARFPPRQAQWFINDAKDEGRRCDLEAGMAKLTAARIAWAAADNAVQIHGGNGFALETPVSRVLADARILNIFEGAGEIQAQVIARRLLEGAN